MYSMDLMTYDGPDGSAAFGGWSKDGQGQFHKGFVKCCSVKADLTQLAASLPWKDNRSTSERYKDLCVPFVLFMLWFY